MHAWQMISSSCPIYDREILPGSGGAAAGSGSVKTDCLTEEESSLAEVSLETQLQSSRPVWVTEGDVISK